MKTQNQITPQSVYPKRPITSQLDFETKIRQVIQDVLAATMRRLTKLTEKVTNFQELMDNYQQKMKSMDQKDKDYTQTFIKLHDTIKKIQQSTQSKLITTEKELTIITGENKKLQYDVTFTLANQIKTIRWQNDNINSQIIKKNNQINDLERRITEMKEHVSMEITKYIEQTIKQNSNIMSRSISFQAQYEKIRQLYQNNRKKYQQILQAKQYQDEIIKKNTQQIESIHLLLQQQAQSAHKLKNRLQQTQNHLILKIKQVDLKNEKNAQQIKQYNDKIKQMSDKIDRLERNFQQANQNAQMNKQQLLKKIEDKAQKQQQKRKRQIHQLMIKHTEFQTETNKKISQLDSYQQKILQIMNQKLGKLKISIQKEIQIKLTKITKQQNQGNLAMNLVKQIQEKLHKNQVQMRRQFKKIASDVKEVSSTLQNKIQSNKQNTQKKLQVTFKSYEKASAGINNQIMKMVEQKIDKFIDQNKKIQRLDKFKGDIQIQFKQFLAQNSHRFSQLDREVNKKIQKTLYMVQKLKGDTTITNQFTQKRIDELKYSVIKSQKQISFILKLIPALSECLNIGICLIYDNQLQNLLRYSEQDGQVLSEIPRKLTNKIDGALYELNQKKRVGFINYRHKQQRRVTVLKTIFDGFVMLWQQLFNNDYKDQLQLIIPKQFYKKHVKSIQQYQKEKQQTNNNNKSFQNLQAIQRTVEKEPRHIGRQDSQNHNDSMSKTFQIRRKRTTVIKSNEGEEQIQKK